MELHLPIWGTGIPCNDKRAHVPGREQSAYPLVALKLPVFRSRFKAKASNFLYLEESQI